MLSSLDRLPDDPAALKAIILAQQEEVARLTASARAYEALVQALKIRIARLQRQKFGPSSEKIEREIEQLRNRPVITPHRFEFQRGSASLPGVFE